MNPHTVIPRFNFTTLFGLLWFSPILLFIVTVITDPKHPDNLSLWLIIMLSLLVGYGLMKGQNWLRYIIALGLLSSSCFGFWSLYEETQAFESVYVERYIGLMIALACFTIGFISFLFSLGMSIELHRPTDQPINYTKAFSTSSYEKWYLFKNNINILSSLGLLFLTPTIVFGIIFFEEVKYFSLSELRDFLRFFAVLFPLIIAICLFLKFKITRYILPSLATIMITFSLIEMLNGESNPKEIIWIIGGHLIVVWIVIILSLMLFHPLITYYFERKTHNLEDYDDILDLE